jgi:hypothetical protein
MGIRDNIAHVSKSLKFIIIQLGDQDYYDPDAEREVVHMRKTGRSPHNLGFGDKTNTIFIGDRSDEVNK